MPGFLLVLRIGNFVGVLLGGIVARIAIDSLKRVQTGGILHYLVRLGLCHLTYQPTNMCRSLKNASSTKGFVSRSAVWSSVRH